MIRLLRKLPSLWLCCNSRCQEMFPKTCFSIRLAAVAHFDTRRSRWTAFFSNKNTAHSRWAGEAGCDSADVSSCWGVIAGDEAVLPHASWISFTSDHLESLFDCDLFAEPSRTLNFLFFHSDGKKNFLEPEKFFFTRCTCFESNFCPPRFLNLTNSPRLNCKDSPRTSSALVLNYAEMILIPVGIIQTTHFCKPILNVPFTL